MKIGLWGWFVILCEVAALLLFAATSSLVSPYLGVDPRGHREFAAFVGEFWFPVALLPLVVLVILRLLKGSRKEL